MYEKFTPDLFRLGSFLFLTIPKKNTQVTQLNSSDTSSSKYAFSFAVSKTNSSNIIFIAPFNNNQEA